MSMCTTLQRSSAASASSASSQACSPETTPAEARQMLQSAVLECQNEMARGSGSLALVGLQNAHDVAVDALAGASGPEAAALAELIRDVDSILNRTSPDDAAAALPTRRNARRQPTRTERLRQQARTFVRRGVVAVAQRRQVDGGDPSAANAETRGQVFAEGVLGDMSNGRMRALCRLGESDIRQLAEGAGMSAGETEVVILALAREAARGYESVIQERAVDALTQAADQFERAATVGSREYRQFSAAILGGEGGALLDRLHALGVDVTLLRTIHSGDDGRRSNNTLRSGLPTAMREAANNLREQANEVASWDPDDARASRAFPEFARDTTRNWAMNGFVGSSVNASIQDAREHDHFVNQSLSYLTIAASVVAGVLNPQLGILVGVAGASAREVRHIDHAWDAAEMAQSASTIGGATVEEAEELHNHAVATTLTAGVSVALEVGAGRVGHALGHGVRESAAGLVSGAAEAVLGQGLEHARHAADEAIAEGLSHHE